MAARRFPQATHGCTKPAVATAMTVAAMSPAPRTGPAYLGQRLQHPGEGLPPYSPSAHSRACRCLQLISRLRSSRKCQANRARTAD